MEVLTGKTISEGVALGRLWPVEEERAPDLAPGSPEQELDKLRRALARAAEQLEQLYQRALAQAGEESADIFRVQREMQTDRDLLQAIYIAITCQGKSALQAVRQAEGQFTAAFRAIDSDYMQARANDVSDVCRRICAALGGEERELPGPEGPVILAAEELLPSQLLALDRDKVQGAVTHRGGAHSHTAILARAMGIAVLSGVETAALLRGRPAAIDGGRGELYLDPDRATLARLEGAAAQAPLVEGPAAAAQPALTRDGRGVDLLANIGSGEEAAQALAQGAQGIGLFRTELLFLGRRDWPGEEEQYQIYRDVVERMAGARVVLRTLDIGGDKRPDYFPLAQTKNEALGLRGIRLCLTHRDIFRTQLRAMLRASAVGAVSILFPMVSSLREVEQARQELDLCRAQLLGEGTAVGAVEVGVMIETPAAVEIAPELAGLVDFFSLGTNDLTQYTLAMDRRDAALADYFDPHHPAVLRQIARTVSAGHAGGCRVGVCGELAADPALTRWFLQLGVEQLSVSPGAIPALRRQIVEMDLGGEEP